MSSLILYDCLDVGWEWVNDNVSILVFGCFIYLESIQDAMMHAALLIVVNY